MTAFGLIVVDKPEGPTSHKIVSIVREGTGVRKVGHAGTLDPRASGVLVLCLGPATRLSEYLSTSVKRYEARVRFGEATETYDAQGPVTQTTHQAPTREQIENALEPFRGRIQQVPPPYSAIRVKGKKAYELAREGMEVKLDPREVTVYELTLVSYEPPELAIVVECSAGTYIRSLAHDLGESLGTGAHLVALRRLKAGPFSLAEAIALDELDHAMQEGRWEEYLLPAAEALPNLPAVYVEAEEIVKLRNGLRIPALADPSELARALDSNGRLVAVLESVNGGREWHPRKVFPSD